MAVPIPLSDHTRKGQVMEIRIRSPRRAVMAAFAFNGAILGTWSARVPAVIETHDLTAYDWKIGIRSLRRSSILRLQLQEL